ncbi:MAG: hypothetical protein EOO48_11390 [Flavobacterium sp.]|nr:MAG: hypothetical protein EOO48_11390 [Flavobacterium sp.]
MKLKFNLFALFLPVLAMAQLSDAEFESIYTQLSDHSKEIPYIGHKEGQTNPFTEEFTRLSWNFSDDDLMYIAQNGNTIMKASAGNELVSRKSKNLTALFSEQLFAKESVTINSGNVGNDYSLSAALYKEIAFQKEKKQRKLYYEKTSTEAQLRGLKELFGDDFDSKWTVNEADSLLTILTRIALSNDDISPETLSQIFRINQYKSTQYSRVKFFASKYPTQEILATLASFKNQNDLQLLRQHLNDSYIAISLFPHPSLLSYLKSNLNTEFQNPEYQQAIAAYKNKESKIALEAICNKISASYQGSQRDEKLFALHGIIEKINCPLYSDLLLKLEKNI